MKRVIQSSLMGVLGWLVSVAAVQAGADGKFHPLLPGMVAERLPFDLPNINNLLYRHDGVLVALGYAGDIYLLRDTDGDGVEDEASFFYESKGRVIGQIGFDLAPEGSLHGNAVFLAAKGKILMIADQDGDDRAEVVQTIAEGWPPARAGVDVTGLALHPEDGSVWFGLGVRLYNDAYEIEETGSAQNDLSSERGSILRIAPDFESREKICTGIRWPIALRFNEAGDLFCTDQEGATWLPNGNPFDELLHIQRGRHYGFPPRHPKHLPGVVDEPSVYDYGPQHQSTCGMNFNLPVNNGPVFGPAWWRGDALVAAESRGKLYRTRAVKTAAGYVAHNEILACLGMLAIDPCVSPNGELRVCVHSGNPDWGTGPQGAGSLWRIRFDPESAAPQPVMAWRESPGEIRVAFDRTLPAAFSMDGATLRAGENVRAGDRFETMRPPYEVVKRQVAEGHRALEVRNRAFLRGNQVALRTRPMPEEAWVGIDLPEYGLQANAAGVRVEWRDAGEDAWEGWLPHLDTGVNRALLQPSARHADLFSRMEEQPGRLTVRTQLDLWQMLHPTVQKGAQLDYRYPVETVTVTFVSNSGPLTLRSGNRFKTSTRGHVSHDVSLTQRVGENRWIPIELTLEADGTSGPAHLTAWWSTAEDRRHRAFPTHRLIQPWVVPNEPATTFVPMRPETQGGDWARGEAVFFGEKALCSTCHQRDGRGTHIGPDLTQLPFKDYASVLRDVVEPSAMLNPDYPTHQVTLGSGETFIAVPIDQGDGTVRLGMGAGVVKAVKKEAIESSKPLGHSLMPVGLLETLTENEKRDLMTYLLHEPARMRDYPSLPRDEVATAPRLRTRSELDAVLAGAPEPPEAIRDLKVVLVAGPKDHGHGEHDYPRWQHVWSHLLAMGAKTRVETAWEWPSPVQWVEADVLVFFKKGQWTPNHREKLETFLGRGGGTVLIHWACEAGRHAADLASVTGLASDAGQTRYRHGLIDLDFGQGKSHPITRGFAKTRFHDESYWNLVGDPEALRVLATCEEEGGTHPLFWVGEKKKPGYVGRPGRIFVSIPGHYSWTFDDPLFRTLLLRGIAWSGGEPVDRFNNLIEAGVTVGE
ncbi:MAG: ThuA domain-containing protein [Verrucomicrobiota bacterium]